MYKLSFAVLAALLSSNAVALDRGVSGVWFDPAKEGQGFELTAIDGGSAVFAWYTYTPTGEAVWLTGVLGEASPGVLRGNLTRYRGMKFGSFRPEDVGSDTFGSVEVRLNGCDAATVTWDANLNHTDGTAYADGTMGIRKLIDPAGAECQATTRHGNYSGFVTDATLGALSSTLLIEPDGTASLFVLGRGFSMGTATRSGDTLTTTVTGKTAVPTNPQPLNFSLSGKLVPRDYYTPTATPISFTFAYLNFSDRPANVATLQGAANESGGRNLKLTIAADGAFTGTDSQNCRYEGRFTAPNPAFNAYAVTATLSACSDSNGSYTGRAFTTDQNTYGDGKILIIGLQGPRHSILQQLRMD